MLTGTAAILTGGDHRFSNGLTPAPPGSFGDDDDDSSEENNNTITTTTASSSRSSRNNSKTSTTSTAAAAVLVEDNSNTADDFSVAPSMDQDVKSVVSVGFDDVYKRGRKVRNCNVSA